MVTPSTSVATRRSSRRSTALRIRRARVSGRPSPSLHIRAIRTGTPAKRATSRITALVRLTWETTTSGRSARRQRHSRGPKVRSGVTGHWVTPAPVARKSSARLPSRPFRVTKVCRTSVDGIARHRSSETVSAPPRSSQPITCVTRTARSVTGYGHSPGRVGWSPSRSRRVGELVMSDHRPGCGVRSRRAPCGRTGPGAGAARRASSPGPGSGSGPRRRRAAPAG